MEMRTASVVGGWVAPDDRAVVAVVNAVPCSGSLIAPGVVLTAAHCLPDDPAWPATRVFFGPELGDIGEWRDVSCAQRMPCADAVLLRLAGPAPPDITPLAVSSVDPYALIETAARVVGFGVTEDTVTRVRRTGTVRLLAVDGDEVISEAAPSSPCSGDSGGPVLAHSSGGEAIIGVNSRVARGCAGLSFAARLDIHREAVIEPFLEWASRSAGPPATGGPPPPCFPVPADACSPAGCSLGRGSPWAAAFVLAGLLALARRRAGV